MTIGAILQAKGEMVVTAAPDQPVAALIAILAERGIGAVPVVANGEVLGVCSERDVVNGLAREGADFLSRPIGDAMTAPAITATRATPVLAALSLMTRQRIRHLPVVEDGRLAGFVSIGDLVKRRIDRAEAEAAALRDYIQAG